MTGLKKGVFFFLFQLFFLTSFNYDCVVFK